MTRWDQRTRLCFGSAHLHPGCPEELKWMRKPPTFSPEEMGWDKSVLKGQVSFVCYHILIALSGQWQCIHWAGLGVLRWVGLSLGLLIPYQRKTPIPKPINPPNEPLWSVSSSTFVVSDCSSKWLIWLAGNFVVLYPLRYEKAQAQVCVWVNGQYH